MRSIAFVNGKKDAWLSVPAKNYQNKWKISLSEIKFQGKNDSPTLSGWTLFFTFADALFRGKSGFAFAEFSLVSIFPNWRKVEKVHITSYLTRCEALYGQWPQLCWKRLQGNILPKKLGLVQRENVNFWPFTLDKKGDNGNFDWNIMEKSWIRSDERRLHYGTRICLHIASDKPLRCLQFDSVW